MNILFVCTGNTCRSCMAEAIFNNLNIDNTVKAYSAGIYSIPGSIISSNAVTILKDKLGIDNKNRKAIQLTEKLIEEANLVITMTESMKENLTRDFEKNSFKFYSFKQLVNEEKDIVDPFGRDLEVYEYTFEQLREYIGILFKKLREDNCVT